MGDFERWFQTHNTWDVSRDDLLRLSYVKGRDGTADSDGDTVYTSSSGQVMTRYMCHYWLSFYGAAQAGWNAAQQLYAQPKCPECSGTRLEQWSTKPKVFCCKSCGCEFEAES